MNPKVASLTSKVAGLKTAVDRARGAKDEAQRAAKAATEQLDLAQEEHALAQKVLRVLQVAVESLREKWRCRLDELGTRALQYVFDNASYKVVSTIEVKHNLPQLKIAVVKDGIEAPVLNGHGGGLRDVLSYVLRAAGIMSRSDIDHVLVADEPFKFVNSVDAMKRIGRLMRELADGGLQQVVVSSKDDLGSISGRHFVFSSSADGAVISSEDRGG